jgi:hypothetical protein
MAERVWSQFQVQRSLQRLCWPYPVRSSLSDFSDR